MRGEHADLVLLQLRSGEALGVGQGLLAFVVCRDQGQVGTRDLDGISEDIVKANLEGMDAGALALPLLDGGDGLTGIGAQRAQLVQLRIHAGRDGAPIGQVHWRIGQERPLQPFPQVLKQIKPRGAFLPARGGNAL